MAWHYGAVLTDTPDRNPPPYQLFVSDEINALRAEI